MCVWRERERDRERERGGGWTEKTTRHRHRDATEGFKKKKELNDDVQKWKKENGEKERAEVEPV